MESSTMEASSLPISKTTCSFNISKPLDPITTRGLDPHWNHRSKTDTCHSFCYGYQKIESVISSSIYSSFSRNLPSLAPICWARYIVVHLFGLGTTCINTPISIGYLIRMSHATENNDSNLNPVLEASKMETKIQVMFKDPVISKKKYRLKKTTL